MNNLTERLNYALQITKIKKAELARAINVKPQTIQFLCNTQSNTQSSRYTFDIAAALGINVKWLASGDGDMFISDIKQIFTMIPLLNHENLYKKLISNEMLIENQELTYLPLITNKKELFAIQLLDSAMAPALPQSSFVFIEKIISAENTNSLVLAYSLKHKSFLVRKLVDRKSKQFLVPNNDELFNEVIVSNEILIVGKVVACLWNITN